MVWRHLVVANRFTAVNQLHLHSGRRQLTGSQFDRQRHGHDARYGWQSAYFNGVNFLTAIAAAAAASTTAAGVIYTHRLTAMNDNLEQISHT